MSVVDQITRLSNAKAAIKTSIENKGVTVGDDVKLDGYPALIDSISVSGGGSGETHINPDFYELRTQNGTNYDHLFYQFKFQSNIVDLSNWDTSNVTSAVYMFYQSNIKSLDLNNWNTSKLKNINSMFDGCSSLTTLNVSSWDISSMTTIYSVFYGCSSLTTLDLSNWDTSKIYDITYIFSGCTKLIDIIGYLDLSNLSNGFCASSWGNPVNNCKSLETLYLKNIYKNITITNVVKYSIDLSPTVIKDECLIYIISELPDLINDKGLTATDKIILTLPPTNTLTAEQVQPAIDKGWQVANVNY